jgi:hypothetical protein
VKFLLLIYIGCAAITVALIVYVVVAFTSVSGQ